MSPVDQNAIFTGTSKLDPPFLLPDSGFVSPANGVVTSGDAADEEDSAARRRSTRKGVGHRDELFKRRLKKHRQKDMVFELKEDGSYEMKEMSVREVFSYVQEIVAPYALGVGVSVDGIVEDRAQQPPPPPSRPPSRPSSPKSDRGGQARRGDRYPGSNSDGVRLRRSWSNAGGLTMSSLKLHLRDMRQLFSSQSKSEPAISVRRNCILINFETIRGIVLVDRILLVVDPGADSILMEVRKAVSESTDDVYEFELKAVEALLSVSSKRLEREVREVERPIADIVQILEGPGRAATSTKSNDRFRVLLNNINVLENRAKARRRALLMVLEDDTDLAMMNLTRMYQNPEDYVQPLSVEVLEDHEEMELLLEAYLQDINSIYNVLELLQGRARSTEALVMVKLDIARNRILTAGLVFSMASTCFTLGALVAGIFGMNLPNGLEDDHFIFKIVSIGTACVCTVSFFGVFSFFYRHGILVS
ncbi:unnamed protein product [Laminaria digitata]